VHPAIDRGVPEVPAVLLAALEDLADASAEGRAIAAEARALVGGGAPRIATAGRESVDPLLAWRSRLARWLAGVDAGRR
jgi:hypothetical protein